MTKSTVSISKQSVEGVAWFLRTAYYKIQEQRNNLMMELLKKMQAELKDLGSSQFIHMKKMRKPVWENKLSSWPGAICKGD